MLSNVDEEQTRVGSGGETRHRRRDQDQTVMTGKSSTVGERGAFGPCNVLIIRDKGESAF